MKEFRFALKQIIPLLFAYLFVGIAFGILITDAGYSPIWSMLMGFFIYAGSMQIVMVPLISAGAPFMMIGAMTFFINARHIFYGLGFVERFRKAGKIAPYMALTLTDETYSILCDLKTPKELNDSKVDFYICLTAHLYWTVCCLVGSLIGRYIPLDLSGIDFSATAFFVAVCVNQWRSFPTHIPALVGFISGLLCLLWLGAEQFILPALSISVILLILLKPVVASKMEVKKDA